MKKLLLKIMSVTMAMITMLVVAAMPVSAESIGYTKTIYGEMYTDTSMLCGWSITYTPVEDSNREIYKSMGGSATLHIGSKGLGDYYKFLVVLVGAEYDDDPGIIYYNLHNKSIKEGEANRSYNSITPGFKYEIEQNRTLMYFHAWHMVSYSEEFRDDKCVDGLLARQSKYYLSVNT